MAERFSQLVSWRTQLMRRVGRWWRVRFTTMLGVSAAAYLSMLQGCGSPTGSLTELRADPFATVDTTVIDGLLFRATTAVTPQEPTILTMSVQVVNVTDSVKHLESGGCALDPRLYLTADRSGRPSYSWAERPNPDPETGVHWGCPAILYVENLAPGDSLQFGGFNWAAAIRRIVGDSLESGRYYFLARLTLNGEDIDIAAGDAVLQW